MIILRYFYASRIFLYLLYIIYKKSSYLSQAAAYRLKTNYYFQLTKS